MNADLILERIVFGVLGGSALLLALSLVFN